MADILRKTYEGRVVLVTGHTGFKGGWLTLFLEQLGAKVVGYSLASSTQPAFFDAVALERRVTHRIGDIRCRDDLARIVREHRPEIIFHLAAQSLVRPSYDDAWATYETNVMGLVSLLEILRTCDTARVCVVVTSDKCYENAERSHRYTEADPLGGFDPYSSSKACAEIVTSAYRRSFFDPADVDRSPQMALSTARAGNVIGGGDWARDRLVPDCMRALSQEQEIEIRHPRAVRPWQYVLEPLGGYLLLGSRMFAQGRAYAGPWNLGPSNESVLTVQQIVELLIGCWQAGGYRVTGADKRHESTLLQLDSTKARERLGWRPVYPIEEAIRRTVRWYRRFYAGASSSELCDLAQTEIRDYMHIAPNVWSQP